MKLYSLNDAVPETRQTSCQHVRPLRPFRVWVVYGTVANAVNVRIAEYVYTRKVDADRHAATVMHGHVRPETVYR